MATEATTYPVFDGVNELIDLYHLAESELVDAWGNLPHATGTDALGCGRVRA